MSCTRTADAEQAGALRYVSGLAPAERPFEHEAERDVLQRLVEQRARKLNLSDRAGPNGELRFEHLFRTRGQGADPAGKTSAATLFRALGAWRLYAGGIPVLGAASAAQLGALLGQRDVPGGLVESASLQFGYLDLGKRKAQRVLAPSYVTRVVLRHKTVRQTYVLAVRATERAYLELPVYGGEIVARHGRTEIARCETALR